jgi:hypothetical protein
MIKRILGKKKEENSSHRTERKKNIQWMFLVKGPAGGLAFEKNSKILESKNLNSRLKLHNKKKEGSKVYTVESIKTLSHY